ncbi:hypothetical protein OESDEN_19457 [Oesophagostomum dentatum]|uniref:Uncharacterized protein n=1 Tax=Oesophagostomum dentatum TaxID=61180 RepID=A0A0B1S691_OESDE|nr:hypothetical protein OESDEN_19457 [Oesophagostomum dentatum]
MDTASSIVTTAPKTQMLKRNWRRAQPSDFSRTASDGKQSASRNIRNTLRANSL